MDIQFSPEDGLFRQEVRQWLADNGYNPDKAKTVEINPAAEFLKHWARQRPVMTLLHELAHAYHDQVLGFEEPRITACFDEAVKSGKYKSVMRDKGYPIRHYALSNHKEYFAEATEAYLWANDYYPFVYGELKKFDPKMFKLLEEIWGYTWGDSKTLDQHIRRIRRKLEQVDDGPHIETVRGVGYRLEAGAVSDR